MLCLRYAEKHYATRGSIHSRRRDRRAFTLRELQHAVDDPRERNVQAQNDIVLAPSDCSFGDTIKKCLEYFSLVAFVSAQLSSSRCGADYCAAKCRPVPFSGCRPSQVEVTNLSVCSTTNSWLISISTVALIRRISLSIWSPLPTSHGVNLFKSLVRSSVLVLEDLALDILPQLGRCDHIRVSHSNTLLHKYISLAEDPRASAENAKSGFFSQIKK